MKAIKDVPSWLNDPTPDTPVGVGVASRISALEITRAFHHSHTGGPMRTICPMQPEDLSDVARTHKAVYRRDHATAHFSERRPTGFPVRE